MLTKNKLRIRAMNRRNRIKRNMPNIILIAFLITGLISTLLAINLILQRRECQMWIDQGLIREQWQADHCESLKVIQ